MKVLVCGSGKMGRAVESIVSASTDMEISLIVDETCLNKLTDEKIADVMIDFSHPSMLPAVLLHSASTHTPVVIGTTGMTDEAMEQIKENGKSAATLYSANYSRGVAVMAHILPIIRETLGESFDIELTETHHNQKVDAPSGTAKLFLRSLDTVGELTPVYGREGNCGKRTTNEIGVHSLRGGTVAGEHTVDFFGADEVLSVTHRAFDRKIFAEGAVSAARKLASKPYGFYTLDEILFG